MAAGRNGIIGRDGAGGKPSSAQTLNRCTSPRSEVAWVPSSSLLAAISSLPAAVCSVTWATLWMALETSWALAACSTVAVAISAIFAGGGFDACDDLLERIAGLVAQLGAFLHAVASIP